MPNWCYNNLEISGSKKDMSEFYSKFQSNTKDTFDFEWFVPMPKIFQEITTGSCTIDGKQCRVWTRDSNGKAVAISELQLEIMKQEYGHTNWYDWAIDNWGCKWNCCDADIEDFEDESFCVKFETPWGPPNEFLETLTTMFPNLYFINDWSEEGGYAGVMEYDGNNVMYQNGRMVELTMCCHVEEKYDTEGCFCPECDTREPETFNEFIQD